MQKVPIRKIGSTFSERVVKAALSIPRGKVSTYGRIARAAGTGAMGARSVTAILGKAWDAGQKDIPFHRIVYADGSIWIHSRHHAKRMRLYKNEGIKVEKDRIRDFADMLHEF